MRWVVELFRKNNKPKKVMVDAAMSRVLAAPCNGSRGPKLNPVEIGCLDHLCLPGRALEGTTHQA